MDIIEQMAEAFARLRVSVSRRYKALVAMAAVVVFVTTYALILPAITMDEETADEDPAVVLEADEGSGQEGSASTSGEGSGGASGSDTNGTAGANGTGAGETGGTASDGGAMGSDASGTADANGSGASGASGAAGETGGTGETGSPSGMAGGTADANGSGATGGAGDTGGTADANGANGSGASGAAGASGEQGAAGSDASGTADANGANGAASDGAAAQQQAQQQAQQPAAPAVPTATVDGVTYTLAIDEASGKAAVIDISDPAPDPETGEGVTVVVPAKVTLDGAEDPENAPIYTVAWLAWGEHSADTAEDVAAGTLHQTGDWEEADQRPHVKELVLPGTVENLDELNFAKFPNLESVTFAAADSTADLAALAAAGEDIDLTAPRIASIPAQAFKGCDKLARVLVLGSQDQVAVDSAAFEGCTLVLDIAGAPRVATGTAYQDGYIVFGSAAEFAAAQEAAAAAAAANGDDAAGNADANGSDAAGNADANADANANVTYAAGTLAAATADGAYTVSAAFGTEAGLPEGVSLGVAELAEGTDGYVAAREAVVASKLAADPSFDESTLGMAALDITFYDASGNPVEPSGPVSVSIAAQALPEDAADAVLEVQHLVDSAATAAGGENAAPAADAEDTAEDTATIDAASAEDASAPALSISGLSPQALSLAPRAEVVIPLEPAADDEPAADPDPASAATDAAPTVVTVASGVQASGTSATVEFTVDSFSVYTITWTKGGSGTDASARTGYVTLHYVNETGGVEVEVTSVPTTDMLTQTVLDENGSATGSFVSIADWAATGGSSRVDGYSFVKATIGSRDGTQITGLKLTSGSSGGSTVYTLSYTTDETPTADGTWTPYTDSASGSPASNADVYLFYSSGTVAEPTGITVHHVDTSGAKLSADTSATYWFNSASTTYKDRWNGGSSLIGNNNNSTFPALHTASGLTYSKAYIGVFGNESYLAINNSLYYKRDSSTGTWHTGTQSMGSGGASVGTELKDANGNPVLYTDIYMVYTGSKGVTVHYVDERGASIQDDTISVLSASGTLTASDVASIEGYTFNKGVFGRTSRADGTEFYSLTYALDDTTWSNTYKATSDGSDTSADLVSEVWLVYTKSPALDVTVHHVTETGVEIATSTTASMTPTSPTLTAADSTASVTGYQYNNAYYLNGGEQKTFSSLTYAYDQATDTWSTTNGTEATTPSPVRDVYLVYNATELTQFAIHRVDESGARLAADNIVPTGTSNTSPGNFNNAWNGYGGIYSRSQLSADVAGSLITAYIGYFNNSTYQIDNGASLNYYYDSTNQLWHTGTGTGATGANKEYISVDPYFTSTVSSSTSVNSDPVLLTDIYQVYSKKGLTVHHVDENGAIIAADTYQAVSQGAEVTLSDYAQTSVAGWSLDGAHLGSYTGAEVTSITYTYDSTNADTTKRWSSTAKNGDTTVATDSVVNEVWLVYKAGASFTVHYVDTAGNATNHADATVSVAADGTLELTSANASVAPSTVTQTTNGTTSLLDYMETRVGAYDGPSVHSVSVSDTGEVTFTSSATVPLALQPDGRWSGTGGLGRTFALALDAAGNYTLADSEAGTLNLSLASGEAGQAGAVYTATFHGEDVTSEYVVTLAQDSSDPTALTYTLRFTTSLPSASRVVYQVYGNASSESTALTLDINDDLAYSGRYVAVPSDTLASLLSGTSGSTGTVGNVVYTWHRVTTTINSDGSDGTVTDETVFRKQTGDNWNIAYDAVDRTWLDVAADEGDDIWTTGTRISYYVTLDYTLDGAQQPTITSPQQQVAYYGQLENGSFETPVGTGAINYFTNSDTDQTRGNRTYLSYRLHGGVWSTTGVGTVVTVNGKTENHTYEDIEIVDTDYASGTSNYLESYAFPQEGTPGVVYGAADGTQFAELNAESAGALYQDVITHPDESLSYGLSHRARSGAGASERPAANAARKYDTMYLVIMPTSLAMTSAADGGELTTQADLEAFIESHGGYSTTVVSEEGNDVIYRDDANGILIRKISSDDLDWHTVSEVNDYVATSSLTRFFFVAGATAWSTRSGQSADRTHGNFLDNVYFSQALPETEGFNLTVSKTFTGLTQADIAALAGTFTLTVSNENAVETSTDYQQNDALSGAQLGFTATQTGEGTYSFTPTATAATAVTVTASDGTTSQSTDLLADRGNTARATVNADGTVTMTWTFTDQALKVGDHGATDQTFIYTVAETHTDLDGYSVTPVATATLSGGSSSTVQDGTTSAGANVTSGATAAYTFTNSYRDNSSDDAPQITVRKVFSGATRATVDKLLSTSPGYSVTLTKTADADGAAIDGGSQPSVVLSANTSAMPANVTFTEKVDSSGRVVLTWVIPSSVMPGETGYAAAMGTPGTYTASETGYTPTAAQLNGDNNKLELVEVNDSDASISTTYTDASGNAVADAASSTTATSTGLVAGGGSTALQPTTTSATESSTSGVRTDLDGATLATSTNIIIAKVRTGSTSDGYLVWTRDALGANLRQAVINFINATDGLGTGTDSVTASASNVSFRSGSNPGKLTHAENFGDLGFTYDSTSGSLTFQSHTTTSTSEGGETTTTTISWSAWYAGAYTASDALAYEVRIANIYDPIVKIAKSSTGSEAVSLAGAQFRLYQVNGNGEREYYLSTSTQASPQFGVVDTTKDENTVTTRVGSDTSRENEVKALAFTTADGTNGSSLGLVALGALARPDTTQTYYLEEYVAPTGYYRVADIAFTVDTNGVVALVGPRDNVTGNLTSVTETTDAAVTWNDPYYTITVRDSPGVELPRTGGPGTSALLATGAVLVALAGAGLLLRRRRSAAAPAPAPAPRRSR